MIVTTTPGIEGKRITKYCGVVRGEAILGANIFRASNMMRPEALVGVDIDYVIGQAGSMMMVSVSGTAVVVE